MNGPDPFKRIAHLYHFTDRRNLPLIRELGGLLSMSQLREKQVTVPAPGGNDWSQSADQIKSMDQYVHLCFKNEHPMEWRARQENRIGDTIFLHVHPEILYWDGVLFTFDIANKKGVEAVTIDAARGMIDFEVLCGWTEWRDPEIRERLRRVKRYEVLVPSLIPLSHLANLP